MSEETITISLEEYKELLIIKGKYEEKIIEVVYVPTYPTYKPVPAISPYWYSTSTGDTK